MEKISIVESINDFTGETIEHIIIDRGNGEFTSMRKSVWDEQQAQTELGGTL